MRVRNFTTRCDQTCSVCARDWWQWLKAREAQMNTVPKKQAERGCVTSFAAAAATSVRPEWPNVGEKVQVLRAGGEWSDATVVHHSGYEGGDGRWWVQVRVESLVAGGEPWVFYVERKYLRRNYAK